MSVPSQQFRNHSIPLDILDELAARFIIPMREEERADLVRVCFLIEQAHWFYIDFYVNESQHKLAGSNMKEFAAHIFQHIPFLRQHADRVDQIVDEWKEYKLAVPTYGAIILNTFMDKVLLVQGFWAKASWGFPKGKVNEDEPPSQCAVREVMEETGFDISEYLEEEEWLEMNINDHTVRLYIIPGVSEATQFQTTTRCEIKDIRWFEIASLPTSKTDQACKAKLGLAPSSFFMVVPFLRDLKLWLKLKQKDMLMYQHCLQDNNPRSRRASEREDFLPASLRSKFDPALSPLEPGSSRARRDSERTTGGSKKKTERISPAKTPQLAAKTSRKQLFTPQDILGQEQPGVADHLEKSEKRRKKKSSSAEPSTPSRPQASSSSSILPDGFIPKAWQHFKLDQELLLSLAFNQG